MKYGGKWGGNFSLLKFTKRLYRTGAKFVFPNNLRISLLRKAGIKIGKNVYIAEGLTLACDLGLEHNLYIQDRVSIAPNVTIIVTSDPNNSKLRGFKNKYSFIEIKGKVTIKHDAWIGAGATILPNVTIGEYAVVGAGAVVTKDVPSYSVVAGIPAKPVRHLEVKS